MNQLKTIKYRFIYDRLLKFGQALYIIGNAPHLGNWLPQCAIRLQCYQKIHWIVDIDIPLDTQIQYKYFISSFDHHYQKCASILPQIWLGNQKNQNFKLFLMIRDSKYIQQSRQKKELKIMSFNLRLETQYDPNQYHWINRKQNCLQVIKQNYPSILGVQEAKLTQRKYLQQNLINLYNYVGISRDYSINGEQVGIFYDKQRFILIQKGFKWISQSGIRGSIGYGASFSRYFTYLILQDTYISNFSINQKDQRNLLMALNVHLDHISIQAQQKGIQFMAKQCHNKKIAFKNQLKDFFIFGDFNCNQKSHIFNILNTNEPKFISVRKLLKNQKKQVDQGCTFNNFVHNFHDYGQKVIDHLFISTQNYKILKFETIRKLQYKNFNPINSIISDHYPILGIFQPLKK